MQENQAIKYSIYTDKGFTMNTYVRCATHGPRYVSPQQTVDNEKMARERLTEEWCFVSVCGA